MAKRETKSIEKPAKMDEEGHSIPQPEDIEEQREAQLNMGIKPVPRHEITENEQDESDENEHTLPPSSGSHLGETGTPRVNPNLQHSPPVTRRTAVEGRDAAEKMAHMPANTNEEVERATQPVGGVDVERSPRPDARDERKVDRLAAPDWRSDQLLPSAEDAVDPRGANTPKEMYEKDD